MGTRNSTQTFLNFRKAIEQRYEGEKKPGRRGGGGKGRKRKQQQGVASMIIDGGGGGGGDGHEGSRPIDAVGTITGPSGGDKEDEGSRGSGRRGGGGGKGGGKGEEMANVQCRHLWVRSGRLTSTFLTQLARRSYGASIVAADPRREAGEFLSGYDGTNTRERFEDHSHPGDCQGIKNHCGGGGGFSAPFHSRTCMIKSQQVVIGDAGGGGGWGGDRSISCRHFHVSLPTDLVAAGDGEMGALADVAEAPARRKVAPLPADIIVHEGAGDGEPEAAEALKRIPLLRLIHAAPLSSEGAKRENVSLQEAIRSVKGNARAKFDETVEAHIRLSVDPRRGDQIVRGSAVLPHGVGKVVRVAVFAERNKAEEAKSAGADVVGADDLISLVKESGGGKLPFDRCIATPAMMPRLGQVGRILGPRGLMPNPKVGTVTNDVAAAVRAAKFGQVEFRADKGAIVHAGLGKVSFPEERLLDNIAAFSSALLKAKPVGLKGSSKYLGYFISFSLSSTMGPGVKVDIPSLAAVADSYVRRVEQVPNSAK
ncbi:hypothetical protein CBR_g34615 [Chara braunii]|uniref:Large ribosomal subunit protein uL1c n=1 Tax=Chara braunii TaxID=69332 RepID=A0A388LJD1_CHABU|nr:hypothetical protein CBR_g34615 [Chara braunii]|eukprot:GBG82332.1 hypothetical protein CBR_g34615 [Chara braunii]